MIIFKNGKQLETTAVYGGTETYQSAQRKTLELMIPADALTLDGADVIRMKLAQKSDMEITQEQHSADISALDAAILEIGELLGGESNG